MARKLVLRLSHGTGDVERVGGALTVGSAAVASGVAVELWLSNDGVELGKPGVVESLLLAHSAPLIELWNSIAKAGPMYACTQCLMRRSIGVEDLRDGVTQAGAAALVASVVEDGSVVLDF